MGQLYTGFTEEKEGTVPEPTVIPYARSPRTSAPIEAVPIGAAGTVCDASFGQDAIRASVFGRYFNNEEQDWSFRHLSNPRTEANRASSIRKHLPEIAKKLGFTRVLAPAPTAFNGEVCAPDALQVTIPIDKEVRVYRGVEADGCPIDPGEAYGISVGGCAVIVAWRTDPDRDTPLSVVAGHAGLRSLVRLPDEPDSGSFRGIVHSVCEALGDPERTHARIVLPIDPNVFTHPWNARRRKAYNRALIGYILRICPEALVGEEREGKIDIAVLACHQFAALGVPKAHLDILPSTGTYPNLVYTTRDTHEDRARQRVLRKRRNLVIITRYR